MSVTGAVAILACGYSIGAALVLGLTHFRHEIFRRQRVAQGAGLLLLAALSVLQGMHAASLLGGDGWAAAWAAAQGSVHAPAVGLAYRLALFLVAPAFYLSSRPLLDPQHSSAVGPAALHLLPAVLAFVLTDALARPIAFGLGAGYLLFLGRALYRLRGERVNFRAEVALLGLAFAIAGGVAVLGALPPVFAAPTFVAGYAIAIGLAFLLVQLVLASRPALPEEVRETAQAAYAQSTLGNVDCAAATERLARLMGDERIYTDPDLDLGTLAARVELSPHQLSELLNVRLGKSFARFLREYRIAAARIRLVESPSVSVLSVGLDVGFATQSTFYEAFREIEGSTPGQYRKLQLKGRTAEG